MKKLLIPLAVVGLLGTFGTLFLERSRAQTPLLTFQQIPHKRIIFTVPQSEYILPSIPAPGTQPLVYLNGLLLCEGVDYNVNGNLIVPILPIEDTSPIVQIIYW